jgi:hypothetical protein
MNGCLKQAGRPMARLLLISPLYRVQWHSLSGYKAAISLTFGGSAKAEPFPNVPKT